MGEEHARSPAELFAELWQTAPERADVGAFLARHPDADVAEVAEVLLVDLRTRYAARCPCAVEEYLRAAPAVAADPERKLDLVYADYLAACNAGTVPGPDSL